MVQHASIWWIAFAGALAACAASAQAQTQLASGRSPQPAVITASPNQPIAPPAPGTFGATFPFAPPQGPVIVYLPPGALPSSIQAWPGGWQQYMPAAQDQQWPVVPRAVANQRTNGLLPWPHEWMSTSTPPGAAPPQAPAPAYPLPQGRGQANGQVGSPLRGQVKQANAMPITPQTNTVARRSLLGPTSPFDPQQAAQVPSTAAAPVQANEAQYYAARPAVPGRPNDLPTTVQSAQAPQQGAPPETTYARKSLFGPEHPVDGQTPPSASETFRNLFTKAKQVIGGEATPPLGTNTRGFLSHPVWPNTGAPAVSNPAIAAVPPQAAPARQPVNPQLVPAAPAVVSSKGLFPRPNWAGQTPAPVVAAAEPQPASVPTLARPPVELPREIAQIERQTAQPDAQLESAEVQPASAELKVEAKLDAVDAPVEAIHVPVAGAVPSAALPAAADRASADRVSADGLTWRAAGIPAKEAKVKAQAKKDRSVAATAAAAKARRDNPIRDGEEIADTTRRNPLR